MRSPGWAVPGDVPALPSDSGSPSSSMWELGASCSLLVLWAISWSLPHHELPPPLPARPPLACFPGLLRPCYSSFSVSLLLLTHCSQDFLPGLVGEGVLRRLLLFFLPRLLHQQQKACCCQPLSLTRTFHSSSSDPPPPAPENKIIFSAVYPCGPLKPLLLPGNGSLRCLFPSGLLSGARPSWICY